MTAETLFILINGIVIGVLLMNIRIDLERLFDRRRARREENAQMLEVVQLLKKQLEEGEDII